MQLCTCLGRHHSYENYIYLSQACSEADAVLGQLLFMKQELSKSHRTAVEGMASVEVVLTCCNLYRRALQYIKTAHCLQIYQGEFLIRNWPITIF